MSEFLAGIDCQIWPHLQGAATAPPVVRELFERDPERFAHCSAQAAGLLLDFSRQRVDSTLMESFAMLAEQLDLRTRTEAMFSGAPINRTEGRAVLHTALRRPATAGALIVEGSDLRSAPARFVRARIYPSIWSSISASGVRIWARRWPCAPCALIPARHRGSNLYPMWMVASWRTC